MLYWNNEQSNNPSQGGEAPSEDSSPDNTRPVDPSISTPARYASTIPKRYKDAYTEAHAVVTVGKLIKGVGVFVGIAIIIAGIAMSSGRNGSGMFAIIGIIGGCVVGIPTYVLGILVAAQGQTQLATLDTAVNSSRHLTDDQVAELLSTKWSI